VICGEPERRYDLVTNTSVRTGVADIIERIDDLIASGAFTTAPGGSWAGTRSGRPPAREPR